MNEDKIELSEIQKQFFWLSRAMRAFVVAFAFAANLRLWNVLRNGEKFGQIFQDMLSGAKIPTLTHIFTTYHIEIFMVSAILTIGVIILIFVKKEKVVFLSFGVLAGFLSFALAEAANQAYWQPIHQIIKQLTG
jgi:hypothetical protein